MITASSASQSYSWESALERCSASPGPAIDVGALVKNVGTSGSLSSVPRAPRDLFGVPEVIAPHAEDVFGGAGRREQADVAQRDGLVSQRFRAGACHRAHRKDIVSEAKPVGNGWTRSSRMNPHRRTPSYS